MEEENNTAQQQSAENAKHSAANGAQNAINKASKAKDLWNKAKKVKALAPIITALSSLAIILLIIIIIIGFIGFFITMPGLIIDKFMEACKTFFEKLVGDQSIKVTNEQLRDLANYVEDMGYDIEAFGFANGNSIIRESSGTGNSKGKITQVKLGIKDMGISEDEAKDHQETVKKLIPMTSDSIELSTDSSGSVIYPPDILSDANIVKVTKGGNVKYYKAVDKDGKNVSFVDSSGMLKKYRVQYTDDGQPVFTEDSNGKTIAELKLEETNGYTVALNSANGIECSSYNDIKNAYQGNLEGTLENGDYEPQRQFIVQYMKMMALYNNYSGVDETKLKSILDKMADGMNLDSSAAIEPREGQSYISAYAEYLIYNDGGTWDNINIGTVIKDIFDKSGKEGLEKFFKDIQDATKSLEPAKYEFIADYAYRKPNLFAYILANERTYTVHVRGDSGYFFNFVKMIIPTELDDEIIEGISNLIASLFPQNFGMISIDDENNVLTTDDIKIDRNDNTMLFTTGNVFVKHQMKWNLSGWTSRYGKPTELSLALHLSTMAPDFVYNFDLNRDLQTKVNIKTNPITYDVKYSYVTKTGETVYKNETDKYGMDGIVPMHKKLEATKDVREKTDALLNRETELKVDKDNNILGGVYPIDVFGETNIVSITNNATGEKKYYKALDEDGDPVPFLYSRDSSTGTGTDQGGYNYGMVIKGNGDFRFTNSNSFNTIHLIKNEYIGDNGNIWYDYRPMDIQLDFGSTGKYTLRLELLSLKDLRAFFKIVGELDSSGIVSFLTPKDRAFFTCASWEKYQSTLIAYDLLITDLRDEEKPNWTKRNYDVLCNIYEDIAVTLKLSNRKFNDLENAYVIIPDGEEYNLDTKKKIEFKTNVLQIWNGIYTRAGDGNIDKLNNCLIDFSNWITEESDQIMSNDNDLKIHKILEQNIDKYLQERGMQETEGDRTEFESLYNIFKNTVDEFTTYQPYIEKVTNHWYKDIYFIDNGAHNNGNSFTAYEMKQNVEINGEFKPEGESAEGFEESDFANLER